MDIISETACFGGTQGYYSHHSKTTQCPMRFSVFAPPAAKKTEVPVLWYLSGLTCSEDNATVKAGFQRLAAELGIMVVCPDTSPRGDGVADDESWDFGQGAGFYLDATQPPWSRHFNMESYITRELPSIIAEHFAGDMTRQGISGHSMGGHGALTLWRKNPGIYKSVSAFAPIVSPINCPWGQKALAGYLGPDQKAWQAYDACALIRDHGAINGVSILVDQGLADPFLTEQLKPAFLTRACEQTGQRLTLRQHEGYDHSYFFIATFMEDHLRHHAQALR